MAGIVLEAHLLGKGGPKMRSNLCVINTKQNTLICRVLGWVRAFTLRKFPRPWQCPNRCFYTPGSILGRILCFSEPYGAIFFSRRHILKNNQQHWCPWAAHKGRRQSSGRETWAKLKSHQIRSNRTVPIPPNIFIFYIRFCI